MILGEAAIVWSALALVALGAGVAVRLQLARNRRKGRGLSDEAIRRIETQGTVSVEDSPELDLAEIREEEDKFWSNPFDDAEPWSGGAHPDGPEGGG